MWAHFIKGLSLCTHTHTHTMTVPISRWISICCDHPPAKGVLWMRLSCVVDQLMEFGLNEIANFSLSSIKSVKSRSDLTFTICMVDIIVVVLDSSLLPSPAAAIVIAHLSLPLSSPTYFQFTCKNGPRHLFPQNRRRNNIKHLFIDFPRHY